MSKAKWAMENTTDNRTYNIARRAYLDAYDYRPKVYVRKGLRRILPIVPGRKKRLWLKERKLPRLSPAIPQGTLVTHLSPAHWAGGLHPRYWHNEWDECNLILSRVVTRLPPEKEWAVYEPSVREVHIPCEIPYSRERRYYVAPLVGSYKGARVLVSESMLRIPPAEDIPGLLFQLQIKALKGEI